MQGGGFQYKTLVQLLVVKDCSGPETVTDIPCRQRLRSRAVVVAEQATAPTAEVNSRSCEIPGMSGFAFHSSHNSKDLRGWRQSRRVWVAGL